MQRIHQLRLGMLILALGGFWIAVTQQPPAQPLTTEKIADDLHVIVGSGGNVAVLSTPDGVILVDDKFERNVPEILARVKQITDKPVRYVLNTHHHGDHSGGNQKLMADSGVEVISHRNARSNMVRTSMPGIPRITFSNETAVHLGGKEVQARYFGRGHTDGDVVIAFPAHKTIHMGDLLNAGAPFIDYSSNGSAIEWTKTLDDVLKTEFDIVIPGHGPIMKRSDMIEWRKKFETMRNRVSDLRRQGKTPEETSKMLKVDDLGWGASALTRSLPGLYQEVGNQ
jgi:glyoxylase-like metal-dependent hydrolase (beta-lactamase superfamily II)